MEACLTEIRHYQEHQQWLGLQKMEKSQNHIAQEHSLSPATVNKRLTGKVTGLSSQLEGTRRGNILSAG